LVDVDKELLRIEDIAAWIQSIKVINSQAHTQANVRRCRIAVYARALDVGDGLYSGNLGYMH
jgi:hypothetical protein